MAPLLVLALLAAAASANPSGYNYEPPKCKLEYASTTTEIEYKTKEQVRYSTSIVPEYRTKYVTRTKVVPSYVYRTEYRTEYVPQEVVRTSTSVYVRDQLVTRNVQLPDEYVTRNVYRTVTKYVTSTQERQVVRTKYQPSTTYQEVVRTEYVRSAVEVPQYVTTTITQTVPGPARTEYRTQYITSTYVRTSVLPAETKYRTKLRTKVNEIVKTEYLPATTVAVTRTEVVYRTSTYTDVQLVSRYTTVAVPVYVTSTSTERVVKTEYVTRTSVRYTTVVQPKTTYVSSKRYVPSTSYEEVTKVVSVRDTSYRTQPVYETSRVQLPDTTEIVYRTKAVTQAVPKLVTVSRPEYRETTVTKTVQGKCGYSYPEPTVQLQYGK